MGMLDQFFKPKESPAPNVPNPIIGTNNSGEPTNIDPATGKPPVSAVPADKPTVDPNNPDSPRTQPNPLDVYSKILDNQNKNSEEPPSFDIPADKLNEVANSLDFTAGIDPELMEKAMKQGDSEAFMKVIQAVSRESYKTAISHTNKLTEAHLKNRSGYEEANISKQVRSGLVKSHLSSTANYNHPVAKRELDRIANDIQQHFPDKSPQEVSIAAKQFLDDLVTSIKDPVPDDPASRKYADGSDKIFDWDSYLKNKPVA